MSRTPEPLDRDLVRLAGVLLVGAVAALLDTTIVAVAIPDLRRDLDTSVSSIQWVTTAYLLAMATVIPMMGWLVDRVGTRRLWLATVATFLLGSILCATAWSVTSLVAFRVVQGLGGGLVLPLVQAILAQEAGPQRFGRVMGLIGIPGQLAPLAGPVLGGVVVGALGWRWIFLLNIPVCVLALGLAARRLRDTEARVRSRLDGTGLVLVTAGLIALLLGLSKLGRATSPGAAIAFVAVGACLLAGFGLHAARVGSAALLDIRLLQTRGFRSSAALMFLFGVALYGPLLLLPLYYQQARGYSVTETGWLLAPQSLGTMASLWIAGRWTDHVGPRRIALAGTLLSVLGTLAFTWPHAGVLTLSCALVLRGAGLGAAGVAVAAASYLGIDRDAIPGATSLLNVTQRIGASVGTATVATILTLGIDRLHATGSRARLAVAFSDTFWWTLAFTALGLLPILALPHPAQAGPEHDHHRPRPRPRTEQEKPAMRAMITDAPGPPDVLRPIDLPDPTPAQGQVTVQVDVAAITFIDTQLRAGTSPRPAGTFPMVIGNGVGGTVIAAGPDVDPDWVGVQVATTTGGHGGYATHALAAATDLHRLPAALELQSAVALLADGRTALGLAQAAGIGSTDTVVVTAAAGGVGSLLVQLARQPHARVIALVGSDDKLHLARELGADTAINYRTEQWATDLSRELPDGADIIFDGVGGATSRTLTPHLRRGARYLPHGAASGEWGDIDADLAAQGGITVVPLSAIGADPSHNHALIDQAFALAAAGKLRPVIGQSFPLERAADAHAAIESRTTLGKTLLLTDTADLGPVSRRS